MARRNRFLAGCTGVPIHTQADEAIARPCFKFTRLGKFDFRSPPLAGDAGGGTASYQFTRLGKSWRTETCRQKISDKCPGGRDNLPDPDDTDATASITAAGISRSGGV